MNPYSVHDQAEPNSATAFASRKTKWREGAASIIVPASAIVFTISTTTILGFTIIANSFHEAEVVIYGLFTAIACGLAYVFSFLCAFAGYFMRRRFAEALLGLHLLVALLVITSWLIMSQ